MNLRNIVRKKMLLALVLLSAIHSFAQSSNAIRPAPERPRLAGMRAMLFYETNGKFSPDIFTNEVNLWNTIIEGASREGASESMLVVVEVHGDLDLVPPGRKIELTARYRIADRSGRGIPAFFRRSLPISLGADHKFFAPFLIYRTGCHPVELTAHIVGQKDRLKKTINLRCGE